MTIDLTNESTATYSPSRPVRGHPNTDLGNAQRMAYRHGDDLRYVGPWETWLSWDGTRWSKDETGEAMRRAKHTAVTIFNELATLEADDQRAKLAKWAIDSQSYSRLRAMLALAQSEPTFIAKPADFDVDPWLLNVANGTIDLRTGALHPHTRTEYHAAMSPVEYDPDAQCPRWEQFLTEIFGGDESLIRFVQRAVGYSLTGDTREHKLFVLWGPGGRNGKTSFVETIFALMGDYAKNARPETFLTKRDGAIPNDLARLKGARFVASSETEEGKKLAVATVKQITGGDTITARFLFREEFDYTPQFKFWLRTNYKPVIQAPPSDPIWYRLKLIPFLVQFTGKYGNPTPDMGLRDKLLAELPGILAWAVRGALDWQAEGLGEPQAVEEATEKYRDEQDILALFFAERTVPEAEGRVGKPTLFAAYEEWCSRNSERCMTQREFTRRLVERGLTEGRDAVGRFVWKGLSLRTGTHQEAEPTETPQLEEAA